MPGKRIFDYWRNISGHPQTVRNKPIAQMRHIDELPCAPGGHVDLVNGTFTILPGQIVRFPVEFAMAGNLHRRTFLSRVTYADFEAAENINLDELTATPEPVKASRPKKAKNG